MKRSCTFYTYGESNTDCSLSFLWALVSLRCAESLSDLKTLLKALRKARDAGLPPASGAEDVGVGNSVSVGVPFAVPALPFDGAEIVFFVKKLYLIDPKLAL